jgi:hypothetical protein
LNWFPKEKINKEVKRCLLRFAPFESAQKNVKSNQATPQPSRKWNLPPPKKKWRKKLYFMTQGDPMRLWKCGPKCSPIHFLWKINTLILLLNKVV